MALADQIERFSRAQFKHKVLGLLVVSLVFGAVFYFMFYSDMEEKISGLDTQITMLRQDVASYEDKKQKYMAFRAEVNKLLEEQKELVKVLPTEAEIPSFLQSLHAQAELAGLNILTFKPEAEQRQNFYAKIPVEMSISGTYHQISKFFYSVGLLKRIVNIQDLQLGAGKEHEQGIMLKAQFAASTFRFLAPPTQAPPAPGKGG